MITFRSGGGREERERSKNCNPQTATESEGEGRTRRGRGRRRRRRRREGTLHISFFFACENGDIMHEASESPQPSNCLGGLPVGGREGGREGEGINFWGNKDGRGGGGGIYNVLRNLRFLSGER